MHENVHFFIEHFSYSRRYFFLDVAFYPARFPISQSFLASSAGKKLFFSFVFLQDTVVGDCHRDRVLRIRTFQVKRNPFKSCRIIELLIFYLSTFLTALHCTLLQFTYIYFLSLSLSLSYFHGNPNVMSFVYSQGLPPHFHFWHFQANSVTREP